MINKKLVKNIVDHTLHPEKKQFIDNQIMHPEREWSFGFLIALFICISGIVWGLHTFNYYKNIKVEGLDVDSSVVVYRSGVVEGALKDFTDRENKFSELANKSRPVIVISEEIKPQATTSTTTEEVIEEINSEESIRDGTSSGLSDELPSEIESVIKND